MSDTIIKKTPELAYLSRLNKRYYPGNAFLKLCIHRIRADMKRILSENLYFSKYYIQGKASNRSSRVVGLK